MSRQHLQQIEHQADPTKLATLIRLARARKQIGWRFQQKTVEEWLQEAAELFGDKRNEYRFHKISEIFEEIGIGAIPILIEALSDKAWRIRISAISLLGNFGPDAITAVPALTRALHDPKARVRREVLKALILIKEMPHFVLHTLLCALRDKDPDVVALATRAIASFGPSAEAALPLLLKELHHSSRFHRSGAVYALGKIGIAHPDVIKALTEKLSDEDEDRPMVIRAFARLAPDVLDQILPHLTQSSNQTLLALVPLGYEAAPLFPALFDLYKAYPDDPVLLIVLSSIGYYAAEAVPLMIERYKATQAIYIKQIERKKHRHLRQNIPIEFNKSSVFMHNNVANIIHALRGIVIDTFLKEEHQREVHPQLELQQVIERIHRAGASRKQRHLLASLKGHALEEHDVLRKRVELGDLPTERLELAAYLGYQPAMRALHQKLPLQQDAFSTQAFSVWADGLARYGVNACARIGHALARSVLPFWDGEYWDDLPPRYAVIALEDWIYAPDRVPQEYVERKGAFSPNQWCSPSSFAAGQTIKYATRLVRSPGEIGSVLFSAVRAWMGMSGEIPVFGAVQSEVPMHRKRAIAQVRKTIRTMLIPWVLQRYDPIRDALVPLTAHMPHDILLFEPLTGNDG